MKRGIVALLLVGLSLFSTMAGAEEANPDKYTELLRADLRTQKVALVTKALDLTQAEGDKLQFQRNSRDKDHLDAIGRP